MQADYGINIVTRDVTTIVYYATQFFWFHFVNVITSKTGFLFKES